MHPVRRPVEHLDRQRRGDNNETANQDDEDRRPVAGVGEVVVEPVMRLVD
jgi:hypothetical protein